MRTHPRKRKRFAPYTFVITIPDYLYPFASSIEGERVRWKRSYDHTLAQVHRRLGVGHFGYKLLMYREAFHFVGALLFIALATYVSRHFFGSDVALRVLFITAVIAISFQEFYLHPRRYGQRFRKSLLDWMVWVIPMGTYLVLVAR